ncbi:hypothetical protein BT69DRAFT_1349452 [Atractiella rhizophila]|nr:hypothetical protein BT69DRAFT_1349452 [Atractiella rhizophila]
MLPTFSSALRRMSVSPKRPLIAIIGTTGVGKSQLSIQLGTSLSHAQLLFKDPDQTQNQEAEVEIVNADAIQCYEGFPIFTNKLPVHERGGLKHHLLGVWEPGRVGRVGEWTEEAEREISRIHARRNIPLAVGGTFYYLQNLIFADRLISAPRSPPPSPPSHPSPLPSSCVVSILDPLPQPLQWLIHLLPTLPNISTSKSFDSDFPTHVFEEEKTELRKILSEVGPRAGVEVGTSNLGKNIKEDKDEQDTKEGRKEGPLEAVELSLLLYHSLSILDPRTSSRLHPLDIRKIRRSLEILLSTGQTQSSLIAKQEARGSNGGVDESGRRREEGRYRSLVFWVWCEEEELERRLRDRGGEMRINGLRKELKEMKELVERMDGGAKFSEGLFQAIGYKEFLPYLESLGSGREDEKLFEEGMERLQTSTVQYAKKQIKWIKNKFIPAVQGSDDVLLYLLDGTGAPFLLLPPPSFDKSQWTTNVLEPAIHISNSFLSSTSMPHPTSLSPAAASLLSTPPATSTSSDEPLHNKSKEKEKLKLRLCETCTRSPDQPAVFDDFGGRWEEHLRSRRHKLGLQRVENARKRREWELSQKRLPEDESVDADVRRTAED